MIAEEFVKDGYRRTWMWIQKNQEQNRYRTTQAKMIIDKIK